MAADPVTPVVALTTVVSTGGTAEDALPGGINGGLIANPYYPTDQSVSPPEILYVDPVGNATLSGNGSTFAILPGTMWQAIPGQTTPTSVNAATSGHKFSGVSW